MKRLLVVILLLPMAAAAQESKPIYHDLPAVADVCWKPELSSPFIGKSHDDAVEACSIEETKSKRLAEVIMNNEPMGIEQRLAVVDCHMRAAVGKEHGWPSFYADLVTCLTSGEQGEHM